MLRFSPAGMQVRPGRVDDATRQDGKNVFRITKIWGHNIVGSKLYWYVEYPSQTSKGHASELNNSGYMLKDYINARDNLKLAYEKMPKSYRIDLTSNKFSNPDLPVFDEHLAGFDLPDGG